MSTHLASIDTSERLWRFCLGMLSIPALGHILRAAKNAMQIVAYTFPARASLARKVDHIVVDSLVFLDLMSIPYKLRLLLSSAEVCTKTWSLIWSGVEGESKEAALNFSYHLINSVEKACSIVKKGFLKPSIYLLEHIEWKGSTNRLLFNVRVLSSGILSCKVARLSFKLSRDKSTPKRVQHAVQLSLESAALVANTLKLCNIPVHPALDIAISTAKCTFGAWKAWNITGRRSHLS